jgi:hypothetical protein
MEFHDMEFCGFVLLRRETKPVPGMAALCMQGSLQERFAELYGSTFQASILAGNRTPG